MLAEKSNHDVAEIEMTWGDRLRAEGREQGWEEGRQEGRHEGRQEGRREGWHQGVCSVLLEQFETRFGPLPEGLHRRVETLEDPHEISRLARHVLTAESLADLGLS